MMVLGLCGGLDRPAAASPPGSGWSSPWGASTSDAARRDAVQMIPLDKLAPDDRAKVESVLSSVSIFRRLPVKVVDCDPDLYLFLVRHPDVVVNIWEIMKVSQLLVRQIDENQFRLSEPGDTTAQLAFVYRSHDTHVLYGEGTYEGALTARPVKGRGVLVLKCGYVRETNGRYYITSRLDCFLTIAPVGAELITKTVSPLMGKTADSNFAQTVAFVGSLSRTAETNSRGVQRLASRLTHVQPEVPRSVRGNGRQRGREVGDRGRLRKNGARREAQSFGRQRRTLTNVPNWGRYFSVPEMRRFPSADKNLCPSMARNAALSRELRQRYVLDAFQVELARAQNGNRRHAAKAVR